MKVTDIDGIETDVGDEHWHTLLDIDAPSQCPMHGWLTERCDGCDQPDDHNCDGNKETGFCMVPFEGGSRRFCNDEYVFPERCPLPGVDCGFVSVMVRRVEREDDNPRKPEDEK